MERRPVGPPGFGIAVEALVGEEVHAFEEKPRHLQPPAFVVEGLQELDAADRRHVEQVLLRFLVHGAAFVVLVVPR